MRIIHCAGAAALLSALAAGSCAKDTAGNGGTGTTESYNDKIDSYLAERYLWNSEYGQMTRDLTIEYAADNDNFLTRTLLGMTSNTLDKKRYTNGTGQNYYKLYSYITRKARSRAATGPKTRGVNHGVRKETEYGFGFARLGVVRFSNTGKAGFYVMAVYPGSPADRAGFRRGTIFSEIDGAEIADSESEYTPVYKRLTSPSGAASVLFKVRETGEETTLTAERLYPNPVLRAEVIEEGEHKIGYMVYNGFDAAYDDDLLDSLRKFRDAGITDLVFDLRYNGGEGAAPEDDEIDIRGLSISQARHRCTLNGQELKLTPLEFRILWTLCRRRGSVVSSEELFESVWGEKYLDNNNTVMAHIARLREKMHEPARRPKFIKTVWGVGYTIEP